MEKYFGPAAASDHRHHLHQHEPTRKKHDVVGTRCIRWNELIPLAQVQGRIQSREKHALVMATLRSYSEIGKCFQSPPNYQQGQEVSQSNLSNQIHLGLYQSHLSQRSYISGLKFDSKGVYLASVTSTGSLAIHDYESLYCHVQGLDIGSIAPVVQFSQRQRYEAVCWNPNNQDEVVCVAGLGREVYCYDIACVTDKPSEILKVNGSKEKSHKATGLFDVSVSKLSDKRVLACGRDGEIHVWDRRISRSSRCPFSSKQEGCLNSLTLSQDEQVVYVGSSTGQIHAWDFRGGKTSAAFITPGEAYNPPFATWKITSLLRRIPSLLAQTEIKQSEIQSVSLNPSCEQQLAFHLNNGWSGVLDLSSLEVTHMHCPPPPWESMEENVVTNVVVERRKPTWLSTNSIYVCGCTWTSKINCLDFRPGPNSPHHVEDDRREASGCVEIETSQPVITCSAHPFNDHIVAGTMGASILVIGQKGYSTKEG